MIELNGIAWDHPRGYEPLVALSQQFSKRHSNIEIKWDVRSLKEFGDMPVEYLIDRYDFITVDHPYMGQADENQLLLNLEEYFSDDILHTLEKQSVGPSFKSYYFNNHLYALPIDAAALVAAYRKDLFSMLRLNLPKNRDELLKFYKIIPNDFSIAWPLCSTDLWCSFLTLGAQDGGENFIRGYKIDEIIGTTVLDEIKLHLEFLHPESINWNPIHILDEMSKDEKIIYSPYLFGYTNYSRSGYSKNIVNFANSPVNPNNNFSTILGGVGMAISSKCKHIPIAIEWLDFISNAESQKCIYTKNGGQPGNLIAWESEKNNKLCNNFFKDTLETLTNAFVRPQHPKWNTFQEQGASLLHSGIKEGVLSEILIKELNQLYNSIGSF